MGEALGHLPPPGWTTGHHVTALGQEPAGLDLTERELQMLQKLLEGGANEGKKA